MDLRKSREPIDRIGLLNAVPNSNLSTLRDLGVLYLQDNVALHINDMETLGKQRFIPKGFELGTTLS
mgnify:CR=1 FL=1